MAHATAHATARAPASLALLLAGSLLPLLAAPARAQSMLPGRAAPPGTQELAISAAAARGRLLMLRHGNAPGTSEPPGFKLGVCSTQRNLDAKGRAQARADGAALRAALAKARLNVTVYTSQWCRAQDTAALLNIGKPQELPALNLFEDRAKAGGQIAQLRAFVSKLPVNGPPVAMVTHQVRAGGCGGRDEHAAYASRVTLCTLRAFSSPVMHLWLFQPPPSPPAAADC